jgi:hypothetical protein
VQILALTETLHGGGNYNFCIGHSFSPQPQMDVFTIHHHPQWVFSNFPINLNGYFHISSSNSMDIFTFHHHPQWIFSHFFINHNKKLSEHNNTDMCHI